MTARPRLTLPRAIFGVATLLGLFSSFQAYQMVRFLYPNEQTSVWLLGGINIGYWYAWALLSPVIIATTRRFPLERGRWLRSLPVHLLAVLVVTVVHIGLFEWVRIAMSQLFWHGQMKTTWWTQVTRTFLQNFDYEMMAYWAIVGAYHAVKFHGEAQARAIRASQLDAQLAEAQLQALQRQLHPHFLFNTLNAISALMHRDVEAADQMLSRLSDLLRMALDQRGQQEVPLKDELEFLQKYLEIEQARFGDRLTVDFAIDPETLDAQVPNLILQPLVENSIRHAVAVRVEAGFIAVKARRADDMLELSVRDNGPGMPPGRLASPAKGVGLSNTRSRLERLYGASQHLTFAEPPGGGLVVTVSMPFRAEEIAEIEDFSEDIKGVA